MLKKIVELEDLSSFMSVIVDTTTITTTKAKNAKIVITTKHNKAELVFIKPIRHIFDQQQLQKFTQLFCT